MTGSRVRQGSTREGRNLMAQAQPCRLSTRAVWAASKHVPANPGAAGVEGPSLAACARDRTHHLEKRCKRVSSGSDVPPPVRRVESPQGAGRTRPRGLPPGADRLAQPVVKRSLAPAGEQVWHPDASG